MPDEKTKWNPRYLNYCRVNGIKDPDKMLEVDRERWPGGCMVGFTIWINRKWQEWYSSIGKGGMPLHQQRYFQDHVSFDRWLAQEKV